jgi:hypothetical protein
MSNVLNIRRSPSKVALDKKREEDEKKKDRRRSSTTNAARKKSISKKKGAEKMPGEGFMKVKQTV